MFCVLFEVNPKAEQWDAYLGFAKMLRPELEKIEGFVENVRYLSLTRKGWILSLSEWENEKALVRWRTQALHHEVQEKGRDQVFADYHLRVGEITGDSRLLREERLAVHRLDETEVGEGTAITLIDHPYSSEWLDDSAAAEVAASLGLTPDAPGLLSWDVFEAVLSPGDVSLLLSWRDQHAADAFRTTSRLRDGARLRQVRVIRDYGMYDRRESPQFYPPLGATP
jgi:heme-degrading monooxygenase HmoA